MIAAVNPATRSLDGSALGDAFGEVWFFRPADQMARMLSERTGLDGVPMHGCTPASHSRPTPA